MGEEREKKWKIFYLEARVSPRSVIYHFFSDLLKRGSWFDGRLFKKIFIKDAR